MPFVYIHNTTTHILHIGIGIGVSHLFNNDVVPGKIASFPLSSMPHVFEVRYKQEGNEFSTGEAWTKAGDLGIAVASGTAAVAAGTAWLLEGIPFLGGSPALAAAATAWRAAHSYGAKYASGGNGMALKIDCLLIPFYEKRYKLVEEEGGIALVDL